MKIEQIAGIGGVVVPSAHKQAEFETCTINRKKWVC